MMKFFLPVMFSSFSGGGIVTFTLLFFSSLCVLFCETITQLVLLVSWVSKPMIFLTFFVGSISVASSVLSIGPNEHNLIGALIIALILGLIISFSANSLIGFYLYLECTVVPTALIVFFWGVQPERLEAVMYLVTYTVIGSVPLVVGVGYLLCNGVSVSILFVPTNFESEAIVCSALLIGFMVKLPVFPLHAWLPNAHVESPLLGSMLLAGVLLKLGVLGVIIVSNLLAPNMGLTSLVVSVSLAGSFLSSVVCVRQTDINAIIAYSSVSHIGLSLACLITFSSLGVQGAILSSVSHGLISPALFFCANYIYENTYSRSLVICKGVAAICPTFCGLVFIVCCANISAPPTLNFFGETFSVIAAVSLSEMVVPLISLCCLVSGIYNIQLLNYTCHGSIPSFIYPGNKPSSSYLLIICSQLVPTLVLSLNLSFLYV